MRVLSWNLFHGRSLPPARRNLLGEFGAALASWDWDLALLQEVPPWWPPALARVCGAQARTALTSRNSLPGLRRAIAVRQPDLLGANGGGANAVLSRVGIEAHRVVRLCRLPERRVAQVAGLRNGVEVINVHLSRDRLRAARELERTFALPSGPAIVGGDFNLRTPVCSFGFTRAASSHVDHVCVRGPQAESAVALDAGRLSDHAPLLATLRT
ncbi:MAG: hypothetical protein NVSMB51_07060 [Solirubrobacteraceae bacterium]